MLYQQHGVAALEPLQRAHHITRLLVAHACHGLVKQQQLGLGHQHHGQLELAPLAMRQLRDLGAAALRQTCLCDGAHGRLHQRRLREHGRPKTKAVTAVRLHGQCDVLKHTELGEHRSDLVRAGQAAQGPLCGQQGSDVMSVKLDSTTVGCDFAAQLSNQGGLAGTIGADDGVQLAGCQRQRELVRGQQAAIALSQLPDLQHIFHGCSP